MKYVYMEHVEFDKKYDKITNVLIKSMDKFDTNALYNNKLRYIQRLNKLGISDRKLRSLILQIIRDKISNNKIKIYEIKNNVELRKLILELHLDIIKGLNENNIYCNEYLDTFIRTSLLRSFRYYTT